MTNKEEKAYDLIQDLKKSATQPDTEVHMVDGKPKTFIVHKVWLICHGDLPTGVWDKIPLFKPSGLKGFHTREAAEKYRRELIAMKISDKFERTHVTEAHVSWEKYEDDE